ncbi:MAG: AAA family ATPase [Candidatus Diapherotrites archaeon]|nr:AAA family ATPase [Candidatus Diapherotrites archaeon]
MPKDGIERVETGIKGLDKALNGGVPRGNLVLISGGAGTGKSTLSLQFVYNGAKLYGEKGVYFTTEQREDELRKQATRFGWDLAALEKKGLLKLIFLDIVHKVNFYETIETTIRTFKPERVVVDSMVTLADSMSITDFKDLTAISFAQLLENVGPQAQVQQAEKLITRNILYNLYSALKQANVTALLVSELPEKSDFLSADEISEFISDGVILLHYLGIGSAEFRSLQIRKMRYTTHEKDYILYDIANTGIEIKKEAEIKV